MRKKRKHSKSAKRRPRLAKPERRQLPLERPDPYRASGNSPPETDLSETSGCSTPRRRGHQDWRTPKKVFDDLNALFHFTVDAAADKNNHLLPRYWTEKNDALRQDWSNETVFCNPPFKNMARFLAKAATAKTAVVIMQDSVPHNNYFRPHLPSYLIYPAGKIHF